MRRHLTSFILGVISGIVVLLICHHLGQLKKKSEGNLMLLSVQEDYIQEFKKNSLDFSQILKEQGLKKDYDLYNVIHNILNESESLEYGALNERNTKQGSFKNLNNSIADYCDMLGVPEKTHYYQEAISSLHSNKSGIIEKKNQLKSIEILLIQDYLSNIYQNSITLSGAQLLSFPEKDTINIGDTYSTNLVFSVYDITGNKMFLELINDTSVRYLSLKGTCFEETPIHKGPYHHDIMLMCAGFYKNNIWQTPIDYYVK